MPRRTIDLWPVGLTPRRTTDAFMKLALFLTLALPAAAQQYSIATVAGGANPATPVSATSISIGQPRRVALDSKGNVYFSAGNSVFEISNGTLNLIAGNSR